MTREQIEKRLTGDRGFYDYGRAPVVDTYGNEITVRESSCGSGACVWIFTKGADGRSWVEHRPAPGGVSVRSPHLNVDQAVQLASHLLMWAADVGSPVAARALDALAKALGEAAK